VCKVQPHPETLKSQPPYPQRLQRTYSSPFIAMLLKTAGIPQKVISNAMVAEIEFCFMEWLLQPRFVCSAKPRILPDCRIEVFTYASVLTHSFLCKTTRCSIYVLCFPFMFLVFSVLYYLGLIRRTFIS
jgi:hypothetical protein